MLRVKSSTATRTALPLGERELEISLFIRGEHKRTAAFRVRFFLSCYPRRLFNPFRRVPKNIPLPTRDVKRVVGESVSVDGQRVLMLEDRAQAMYSFRVSPVEA